MGKTRAEVRDKLNQALNDMNKGVPVLDERQTVKQYLTTWYEGMKAQIRISTYRRYGDYVNHLMAGLGHVALTKLTPQHLQMFYNLDTPPAKAGRFSVLRRGYRHASPTALTEPFYVLGGVVVPMQACPTVRAALPADGYALLDQDAAARTGLAGVGRRNR
jgi:hypothetical protein